MAVNTSYQDHYHNYRMSDRSADGLQGKMTFEEFAKVSKQVFGLGERDARRVFDETNAKDPEYVTISEFGKAFKVMQSMTGSNNSSPAEPAPAPPTQTTEAQPVPDNRFNSSESQAVVLGLIEGQISPSQVQRMLTEGRFDNFSQQFREKLAKDSIIIGSISQGIANIDSGFAESFDLTATQNNQDDFNFINAVNETSASTNPFGDNNDPFGTGDDLFSQPTNEFAVPGSNEKLDTASAREVMIALREQQISPNQVRQMLFNGQFDNFSEGFRERLAKNLDIIEAVQ